MDTKTVLSVSDSHRRTLIILLSIVTVAIFIGAVFASSLERAFGDVLASLVSGLITTLALVGVGYYLLPNEARGSAISEISPQHITRRFDAELASTTNWYFAGNLGRYLRSKVLSTLSSKPTAQVFANILDPMDQTVRQRHAQYRRMIKRVDAGSEVNERSILVDAIVTIVACAWYTSATNVSIHLRLHSAFSPVRIDAGDSRMFLTVEDRREPALEIGRNHFMYSNFRQQIDFMKLQGREVSLQGFPVVATMAALSADQLRAYLSSIGFAELLSDDVVNDVLAGVKGIANPYP